MKALSIGLACACAALLPGCATTRIDAQWVDPQRASSSLVGRQVLVDCIGPDTTLQRLCSQQLAMQLSQRGVRPLTLDAPARVGPDQVAASDAELLDKARSLGAQAVLRASVTPEVLVASPGPSVGVGIGGFGGGWGGYGGSGVGVSLGVGFPVGGSNVNTGFAAKGALSDVASGRLVWSANASTPATFEQPFCRTPFRPEKSQFVWRSLAGLNQLSDDGSRLARGRRANPSAAGSFHAAPWAGFSLARASCFSRSRMEPGAGGEENTRCS